MELRDIPMGALVRDTVSGLEGVVMAKTEWRFGCARVSVQPLGSKDGKPFDTFVVDVPQLELVALSEIAPRKQTGGDRPSPAAHIDPVR